MKNSPGLAAFILLFAACANHVIGHKEPIFAADRKAPLGWVYLTVYQDSSFEFVSQGLRSKADVYAGRVSQKGDTLFFNYTDSVPKAGKTAIVTAKSVRYIDGAYPESMGIRLNKLGH